MSTVGGNLRKLNKGATLTFPYPAASKLFLFSNAFMAKSGEQTLDVQKLGGQTKRDGQTKKLNIFSPPRRRVKSETKQTWYGDQIEDLEHVLAPVKRLGV